MSTMNVYFCGGAAVNIGNVFDRYQKSNVVGQAEFKAYYIDTSDSNLSKDKNQNNIYLFDGKDGSGKKRNTNVQTINERTPEILLKFKPADVNVVVHSSSGGSGSVIGPTIVSELLNRNEVVIVLLIGSTNSRIEVENNINTIKSYESISKFRKKPVVAYYRENSKELPKATVDTNIQMALALLQTMFSGQNHGLDLADLTNFINFDKVTNHQPRLTCLDFFSKTITLSKSEHLIAVTTLLQEGQEANLTHMTEYHTEGVIPNEIKDSLRQEFPIHACVIGGTFVEIAKNLSNMLKQFEDLRKTITDRDIVTEDDGDTNEFGLIV